MDHKAAGHASGDGEIRRIGWVEDAHGITEWSGETRSHYCGAAQNVVMSLH